MDLTGNEPINPIPRTYVDYHTDGLTIREEFSARFMAALLTNSEWNDYDYCAEVSIKAANALIRGLNNPENL